MLKFCNCKNLLTTVISPVASYNKCTACNAQIPLEKGDTLLRITPDKPSGYEKNKHIINNMHNVSLIPYDKNAICYECNCKFVKYAILDNVTYYKCTNCLKLLDDKLIFPKS